MLSVPLRSIHLTVVYDQQLLSLETGFTLTEANFPIIAEGSNMSTVSVKRYGKLAQFIDKMDVSNNTAFY